MATLNTEDTDRLKHLLGECITTAPDNDGDFGLLHKDVAQELIHIIEGVESILAAVQPDNRTE